jgi:heptosyltransferase-2
MKFIVEPTTGCDCYYGTSCKRERPCMLDIAPEVVFDAIEKLNKSDASAT